ncbi:MAG: DUF1330 domain-containing protein [Alphaproteobacteria bacterium]
MSAYLIAHRRDITDGDELKKYREGIDQSIARFGGKVLVRADGFDVLEGDWHSGRNRDDSQPERVTVIEFRDMKTLREWYDSRDYAPLKSLRQDSSASDVVAVQGL